jgi:hypothetical protein
MGLSTEEEWADRGETGAHAYRRLARDLLKLLGKLKSDEARTELALLAAHYSDLADQSERWQQRAKDLQPLAPT